MNKILILLDTNARGGAERSSYYFCKVLKSLNYEVDMFFVDYVKDGYDFSEFGNIVYYKSSRVSFYSKLLGLWHIKKYFQNMAPSKNYYLLVSFHDFSHLLSTFLKNSISGSRVFSERKLAEVYFGKKNYFIKPLYKFLLHKSDTILVNDSEIKESLRSYYRISKDIVVINNYVDIENILNISGPTVVNKCNENYVELVSVGRLSEEKGQNLAILALSKLKNEMVRLHIIGNGPDLTKLKELVRVEGLTQQVIFHGALKNPFSIMANSDLYVCTSKSEGFPNVLIEAMALKLPIVSLPFKSGLKTISDDGKYVYIVKNREINSLSDALDYFISDVDIRRKYSTLSAERVKSFSDFNHFTQEYKKKLYL